MPFIRNKGDSFDISRNAAGKSLLLGGCGESHTRIPSEMRGSLERIRFRNPPLKEKKKRNRRERESNDRPHVMPSGGFASLRSWAKRIADCRSASLRNPRSTCNRAVGNDVGPRNPPQSPSTQKRPLGDISPPGSLSKH